MNKVIVAISVLLLAFGYVNKTSAQNVVNKYAAVKNYDQCVNRIFVDDASEFNVGDTILIIQMKTFSIDTTTQNDGTWGSVLTYNNCGNYEYNTIKRKDGNVLRLKYNIKKSYDWVLGKVQIVRVAYYNNLTVNAPGITCAPWDGNKGGVVAIKVSNTLTLNADIDVSGKGFKGGQPQFLIDQSCNKTDYYYPPGINDGAAKGEGIGILPSNKYYGRGKIANGGGGGNSTQSGGGGGSNGGKGGDGGDQYQAAFWCLGTIIPQVGGVGGLALDYNFVAPTQRAYLGGGGGCGHGWNNAEKAGGNGGGIIMIDAPNIIGNNNSLISNGDNAPECSAPGVGCQDDGGGGGGGGGCIVINSTNITNLLKVTAKGGKGSDVYAAPPVINATFQPGPGGGGGGGAVWFNSAATPAGVTVNTTAGLRGGLPQFFGAANGADNGDNGITKNNLVFPFPAIPADTFKLRFNLDFQDSLVQCATRKFVNLSFPTASVFAWWWNFGDGGTSTQFSPTHTYGAGGTYNIILAAQDNFGCTDTLYRQINVQTLNYGASDTVLGCKTHEFRATKITGPNAVKYEWNYGDNDTGSGNPSSHVYAVGGTYTVVLTVTDSIGCQDTLHFTANVADITADYTVNDDTVCQGETVKFTDASTTNAIFWGWNLGDGTIDSTQNPNHIYPNMGVYNTKLVVGNITGCRDSAFKTIVVDSISSVTYIPSDTILCEGQTISLNGQYIHDNSTGIDWNLGDGFIATNVDPAVHAYDTSGNFNVTLTVHFRACPDVTASKLININPFPTVDLGPDTSMCPNGPALVLTDNINVSEPTARWHWNTGDSSNSIIIRHPGLYTATVNVRGCSTNDSVEVFKDCYIDIPNAFTPNNDGSNDYFLPRQLLSKNVTKFNMTIFDRWGQKIFETANTNGRGWDGKFNDKEQPMGVYVYLINVTFASGASESYSGNITLIR